MNPYQAIRVIVEADISTSAKAVALVLFHHQNRATGRCNPSVATIAQEAGMGTTSAKAAIKILRDEGLIEWEAKTPRYRKEKVNHYNLLFSIWSPDDQTGDQTTDHSTVQTTVQTAVQTTVQTGDDHEHSEQSKQTKQNKNRATFAPPLLEEVKEYCEERKNGVDPERWHDFYVAKGWMVGKNKMKDWKAAVRTWEKKAEPAQEKVFGADWL